MIDGQLLMMMNLMQKKNWQFHDYLQRLFSTDFSLRSWILKYEGDVVICGESLLQLYIMFRYHRFTELNLISFYVMLRGNDYNNYQNIAIEKFGGMNFKLLHRHNGSLVELAKQFNFSAFELAYCIKSKELFIGENVEMLFKNKLIFIPDLNRKIIFSPKQEHRYHPFFDRTKEILIYSIYNSITNINQDTEDKSLQLVSRYLDDMYKKIELSNYMQIIKEDYSTLEFILRIYFYGTDIHHAVLKDLGLFHNLFKFIKQLCNHQWSKFLDKISRQPAKEVLRFIDQQLEVDCVANYLFFDFDLIDLMQDLSQFKDIINRYNDQFFKVLELQITTSPKERISVRNMYESCKDIIRKG